MPDPDLTDMEKRLSGWRPAGDGLDADAMLFAAGRASARHNPARFAWPAIAAGLAVAVGILGVELAEQRSEHRALLARIAEPAQRDVDPSSPLPECSYFVVRQSLQRDSEIRFPADPLGSVDSSDHPVLRAGERNFELK